MQNLLLEKLRPEDPFLTRLEPVDLCPRQVLEREDAPAPWIYFPVDCVLSLRKATESGPDVQIGTIGREGGTTCAATMPGGAPLGQLVVQTPGRALRMDLPGFRQVLDARPELRDRFDRYGRVVVAHIIQSAVCNQLHSAFERCARWLLTTRDRRGATAFTVTHEQLAEMLGMRRATVTEAAQQLKRMGAIAYRRGRVQIADDAALERASCECHAALAQTYQRLLGD